MKKLLFVCLLFVVGCSKIETDMTYGMDHRTGLCFAWYSTNGIVSTVPCTKAVLRLCENCSPSDSVLVNK